MKFYNSLEEKEKYFIGNTITIENLNDLIGLEKELNARNDRKTLYRGQSEAKYKLYSSLQRLWLTKELDRHYNSYEEFVNSLINHCSKWNDSLIPRYLKHFNAEDNKISTLSIMQHFGVPTPLLDFTEDFNKSLFFAIDKIDLSPSSNKIDNYFSIHYIFKNNAILSINDYIKNSVFQMSTSSKAFDIVKKFNILLIDNSDLLFRIQNSLNIISQNGAFIYNSSGNLPLEEAYLKFVPMADGLLKASKIRVERKIGGCININKKLTSEIREFLKSKKIEKSTIYPDLNELKDFCLNEEWRFKQKQNEKI